MAASVPREENWIYMPEPLTIERGSGPLDRSSGLAPERVAAGGLRDLLPVMALTVPASCLLAVLLQAIYSVWQAQPAKAVTVSGLLCGCLMAVLCGSYLAVRGKNTSRDDFGLLFLAGAAVCLAGIYLFWVASYVAYPGDFLIWSESDFVNDILKFRVGYPLYTAQANNESFPYPPGSQLLTYFLAWISGWGGSIPVYRAIQLIYTLAAAAFASLSSARLYFLASGRRAGKLWHALWFPALFLIATNSVTDAYIHNLHNDALAQLISAIGFYLLLCYVSEPRRAVLVAMALLPAVGFLVKQSLAIWAILYVLHLGLFDARRSFGRALAFGTVSIGAVAVAAAAGYAMWREHFVYWVFQVLGKHGVVPLRSFQHALMVWPYLAIGVAGGLALLRGRYFRLLLGPWVVWLCFIAAETYTSGVAWMLNHIGPGSLLAGVWFFAAMPVLWRGDSAASGRAGAFAVAARAALCLLLFNGLGLVRIPLPALTADAYRYQSEIEAQFRGQPAGGVLLDAGTWVYARQGVVMKDRAPSIGERGYSGTGDFSGMIDRLNRQEYSRILLRNYRSQDFWYDHASWKTPSGIRGSLAANYHEAGRIRAVTPPAWAPELAGNYLFSEMTILVPNGKPVKGRT